jgi:hypothetical protein
LTAHSEPRPGTSGELARKLSIKSGMRLCVTGAPPGFARLTPATLPDGVRLVRRLAGTFDVIVAFSASRAELEHRLPRMAAALGPAGGLWIAWPKRSSAITTDLSDGVVRELGLAAGLVDNKVCAIDETWSGLRFVYRLADRPAVARRRT